MKLQLKRILLVALLLIVSCKTTVNTSTWIKVYEAPNEPTKPFSRVKVLATHDFLWNKNKVVNKFISKAERENADAIILYSTEESKIGKSLYKAVAIKWVNPEDSK